MASFDTPRGVILVAAPTIPAQQGEEGPKPLPYGFSHETLMDNPLLSDSEHPAQYRASTVPAKVLDWTFRASETQPGVPPAKGGCRIGEATKINGFDAGCKMAGYW